LLACGLAVLLLGTCDQAPIFDMISREVKPREPRIKGVPTKMVVFNRVSSGTEWGMYVADSSLHRYAKNAGGTADWDEGDIPQPPGDDIFDLAATDACLYALVNVDSPKLYRFDRTNWTEVGFASGNDGYSRFQVIYGECDSKGKPVSGNLYVGARNSSGAYAVFSTGSTGSLTRLGSATGLLTGAAYDGSSNHYISTEGGGVYQVSGSSATVVSNTSGLSVTGMIQINDSSPVKIIALCGNGDLYTVSGLGATKVGNAGITLTGGAAVWTDGAATPTTLLLLAVRSSASVSNSTYGYREIVLSSGALPANPSVKEPGTAPSTVDDNKRYRDTIEPKPVNAILQAPDEIDASRVLFASVQGRGTARDNTDGGLWSYRPRSGVNQWNAEE
jgi:hypothetical protein